MYKFLIIIISFWSLLPDIFATELAMPPAVDHRVACLHPEFQASTLRIVEATNRDWRDLSPYTPPRGFIHFTPLPYYDYALRRPTNPETKAGMWVALGDDGNKYFIKMLPPMGSYNEQLAYIVSRALAYKFNILYSISLGYKT